MPAERAGDALLDTWLGALRAHGDLWGAAWQNVLAGEYGPDDFSRDLASSQRLHFAALRSLFEHQAASKPEADAPPRLNIEVSPARPVRTPLRGKAKTRRFEPEATLYASELTRADSAELCFEMEVTAVSAEHVLVEISHASVRGPSGKYRSLPLERAFKDPRAVGSYFGVVSDSGATGGAPLVVVSLLVRG